MCVVEQLSQSWANKNILALQGKVAGRKSNFGPGSRPKGITKWSKNITLECKKIPKNLWNLKKNHFIKNQARKLIDALGKCLQQPQFSVKRGHRHRVALGMLGGTSLRSGNAVKTPSSEVSVYEFSACFSLDLSMTLAKGLP